jgi:L-amino acid N-acyltransferase YncA
MFTFIGMPNRGYSSHPGAYVLPNPASAALHEHFGCRLVGVFSDNGRKLDRYWDVAWTERPLRV